MFTVDAPGEQADEPAPPRLTVPSGPYARRGDDDGPAARRYGAGVPLALAVAGLASLAAGAIHATAAGTHSSARAAATTFVALGLAQLAWGAYALVRSDRLVTLAGAALNAAAGT